MQFVWMFAVKRTKKAQERVESRVLKNQCVNLVKGQDGRLCDCDKTPFRNGVCRGCDYAQIDKILNSQKLTPQQYAEYIAELVRKGYRCEPTEVKRIRIQSRNTVAGDIADRVAAG